VPYPFLEELDPDKIPQFGLIAEEVQKVDPDLVVKDEDGKVSTVRYEAVNAMLLNKFLKEHRRLEEQRSEFEAKFAQQQKQIETLTAGMQEIGEQLQLNRSTR
jgi:DNA gyrase/topoisomerase IV subunit A